MHSKIRKRGADTCADCLKAEHSFCAVGDGGGVATLGGGSGTQVGPAPAEGGMDDDDNPQLVAAIENVKVKLAAAHSHINQYQAQ